MNDLQQKELELLKMFVDVCNSLNLRYYLVCGSALGAVKYKGFIPWDDDIDVGMPREDYEIFIKNVQPLLPNNIFLQNYKTDPSFPHVYSKLRNSDTTYIEKNVAHLKINHGVYIDVFPLDGYPQTWIEKKALKYKKKFLNWLQYCALDTRGGWRVDLRNSFFKKLGFHKKTHKTLARLERLISRYSTQDSKIWCNHGNWQGELEYAEKGQYNNGSVAEFEGIKVRIPENYDAYLTQKYGDWRADLPEEQKRGHHYYTVCDLENPYTKYIK